MEYKVNKQERYSIFCPLEKNLNAVLAPDLKSEFVIFFNEGVTNFIFDLSNVEYIDSSGLSAILTGQRLWGEKGAFVLTGVVHPSVKRLMEISHLHTVLPIVPTIDEAIEYAFMEELQREIMKEGDDDTLEDDEEV
jgi:anti-anti-sigma factor